MTSDPEMLEARATGRAPVQVGQCISVLAGTWPEAAPLWMRGKPGKAPRVSN